MTEGWIEELRSRSVDLVPREGFREELRNTLENEWRRGVPSMHLGWRRRRWVLAAVSVSLIGALVVGLASLTGGGRRAERDSATPRIDSTPATLDTIEAEHTLPSTTSTVEVLIQTVPPASPVGATQWRPPPPGRLDVGIRDVIVWSDDQSLRLHRDPVTSNAEPVVLIAPGTLGVTDSKLDRPPSVVSVAGVTEGSLILTVCCDLVDGVQVEMIVALPGAGAPPIDLAVGRAYAVSPDGESVVATVQLKADNQVAVEPQPEPARWATVVLDFATGSATRIGDGSVTTGDVVWSDDGSTLTWMETDSPLSWLAIVRLAEPAAVDLVEAGFGTRPTILALTPAGHLVVGVPPDDSENYVIQTWTTELTATEGAWDREFRDEAMPISLARDGSRLAWSAGARMHISPVEQPEQTDITIVGVAAAWYLP